VTRIRTTHTGSLPRPPEILQAVREHFTTGKAMDEALLARTVGDIVRRQVEAGIDVVTDGEMSKPSFFAYLAERMDGFDARTASANAARVGPVDPDGRDALMFPDYYRGMLEHSPFANTIRVAPRVCVAPLKYVGRKFLERDIANLKRAMAQAGASEGFMPAASPLPFMTNEHYRTEEEYFEAYGEQMREEYRAILDAGLYLQIDDPRMVSSWDSRKDMDLAQYRSWMRGRIEHINHALRGLPAPATPRPPEASPGRSSRRSPRARDWLRCACNQKARIQVRRSGHPVSDGRVHRTCRPALFVW